MTRSLPARLPLFVGGVVLAESAFYAVVPPLIPGFVREVHMTTTEVGVLVAGYPAGVLGAAVPAIALIDRIGERRGTSVGLVLLVMSTLGFAWGTTPLLLDIARFVQGVGGAIAWTGALAWLTSASPRGQRASVIGGTVGAALTGMVLGPGIGAAASQVGRGTVFSALALVLMLLALSVPAGSPVSTPRRHPFRALGGLLRNGQAALGTALLAAIGIVTGTIATLMPLLVSRRQGSAALIAAILAASYLLGSLLNVVAGRIADRVGRLAPTLFGFLAATALLPTLPSWTGIGVLAVVAVIATACIASLWTPTAAMVTDGADEGASGQAVAVAISNAAWAAGATAGAAVASWIAQIAGLALPLRLLGVLCGVSVVVLVACRRATASQREVADQPGALF